ncbi:MAG TPA: O-antigen ligase family protein [Terriglobales bacterium]|nr:O-antigen ligase family protein [Terriglobales bacterium]
MPRFKIMLFSLHVRPEHVATSIAILAIIVQLLRGQIALNFRPRNFDYWVLAYVAANFFSSALTSPQPVMTLRWATLNALVVIPYFLVRLLVKDDRQVWLALQSLLWVGLGESIYGTFASVSNHVWGTTWGVELGQYGAIPGTFGTQYEANLFGSYTACTAIMFLALYLLSKERGHSWYGWGVAWCLAAAFFSLARSVLLGLPFPIFALLWISAKKGRFQLRRLLPLAVGVSLVLVMLSPFVLEYVSTRFSTIGVSDVSKDVSTAGRLLQMGAALEDVKVHPVFGTGTASFQLLFKLSDLGVAVTYEDDDIGWISSTPLRILHDTGIAGLAIFLVFLGTLARVTYRARRVATPSTKVSMVALSAGLILYAITFQATEATLLTFTWIHLGLLAAAAAVATDSADPVQSLAQ